MSNTVIGGVEFQLSLGAPQVPHAVVELHTRNGSNRTIIQRIKAGEGEEHTIEATRMCTGSEEVATTYNSLIAAVGIPFDVTFDTNLTVVGYVIVRVGQPTIKIYGSSCNPGHRATFPLVCRCLGQSTISETPEPVE